MNCIHLAIFRKVFCWKINNVIMYCLLFVLLAHDSSCQHIIEEFIGEVGMKLSH